MNSTIMTSSKNFVDGYTTFTSSTLTMIGNNFLEMDQTIINTSGPKKFTEAKTSGEYEPSESPKPDSDYMKAQEARRLMIYVHAKMMTGKQQHPESTESVRKVNQIADKYQDLYASENLEQDLPGHFLRYPIGVASEGNVTELPETEFFPDTKARVLGAKSDYLPPILTS
ncbi:phospholipase D alpha 1 [Tanacetum coccineum]